MLDSLLATAPDLPPGPPPGAAARDARGRFRPGVSGNPAGKRPGTRHIKTLLEESLSEEEGRRAARVVIEAAVEGDKVSARWLVGRIDGAPKGRFIEFAVEDNGDMTAGLDAAFRGVMDGTVTLAEAWDLMRWVQAYRNMVPPGRRMDSPLREADPDAGTAADVVPEVAAETAMPDAAADAEAGAPAPAVATRSGRVTPAARPDSAGSPAKHLHLAGEAAAAAPPPIGNRAMRRRAAALARAAA